jgi:hypothetical protein
MIPYSCLLGVRAYSSHVCFLHDVTTRRFPAALRGQAAALIDPTDPDTLYAGMVKIGQGASAVTYRAVDRTTGIPVAMKVYKAKIGKVCPCSVFGAA